MHRLRSARANTCARHTRLRTIIFSRFRCHAEGTRRTERSERGADNSELRTRQSHLLAEVLHLINGSRLHCALNHAQIKKLVIFKINGGRGQPLDGRILSPADFVTPAQLPSSLPPSLRGVSHPVGPPPPPPPPRWSRSSASVGCTHSFPSIIYSAFHHLLLLFRPFLTPLSYQLSSQSHILISTHITFTSRP